MATAVGMLKTALPLPFDRPQSHPVLYRNAWVINPPASPRQAVLCSISSPLVEGEQGLPLGFSKPEAMLIDALLGVQGRGRSVTPQQLENVERAVKVLENTGGVPDPTNSDLIEGCWQLIFTTRPGTASPIQRTFVGVDIFKIFQEINLGGDDPRVSNIVQFSDTLGELKVEAAARIKDGKRILFRFDRAAFSFKFLPFKVPYPVPFRLLGDEAKGWLDTTYLSYSGNLRISRGNKGTTFLLQKVIEPRQKLLSAISSGIMVEKAIYEFLSLNPRGINEECEIQDGEWQLIWASQVKATSYTELAATGLKGLQIIKENGSLENIVDLFPGVQVCSKGKLLQGGRKSYIVLMSEGLLKVGSIQIPLSIIKEFKMELLFTDKKIRISKANEITFVHLYVGKSKKGL